VDYTSILEEIGVTRYKHMRYIISTQINVCIQ
jgi:hypothetical protein